MADWIFTLAGIVLILVGGYGAAGVAGLAIAGLKWLVIGEVLFAVSGLIWLAVSADPDQTGSNGAIVTPDAALPAQYL